jgi:tetratricopeptide (TPR) repeat protein
MSRGRTQQLVFLLVLVAAPSLLAATSLPPLPQLKTTNLFPGVVKQVKDAYQAARAHPMDAAANGTLAMVLDTYEQYSLAGICYLRAHRLDPKSFDWGYNLGHVLFKEGRYPQAAEALREALKIRPDYVPAELELAESLFSAHQIDAAGKLYQEILQQNPTSAEAWYGLGRVQATQDDTHSAAVSLAKACELVPQYGAAQFALATAYRKLGQADRAREHFKLYQANMTNVPPAVDPVRAAVQQLDQSATAHLRRGLALAEAGDLQGAIQQHLQAIQSDPKEVQGYINLIQLYARVGETDKAVESYHKAVAINPNRSDCYYNYGVLMFERHNFTDAEQAMQKAIQINPYYAEAHDSLGYLMAMQGHLDEALVEYRKAVAERPDYRRARFHIGQVLVNQGKYAEAIQEFQKILTPNDTSTPGYLYALGATYARAGDRQNALLYMHKARDEAAAQNQAKLLSSIKQDIANLER